MKRIINPEFILGQKSKACPNKGRIVNILLLICFGMIIGCQQPEELLPPVAELGLNSVVAQFVNVHPLTGEILDLEGEFRGVAAEGSNEIIVIVPYYYPENSENRVSIERLKKMRVRAILDDNVTISPPLVYLDMTVDNKVTITNVRKEKKEYILRGEIRKSNASKIEDFYIPSMGISGIINENEKIISLPNYASEVSVLAQVRLSPNATISPDPTTTPIDYNNDVQLTVTAHDGVSKSVYTLRAEEAKKLSFGMRANSAKIMFEKRMRLDLGISNNLSRGIAATKDHVIINVSGQNSVYINAKTGEKEGEINLGSVMGANRNYYSTSDAVGNVVICNRAPNDGSFKVWKLTDMSGSTQLFIEWNTTSEIGNKLSIQGNINENAIITAPLYTGYTTSFARWQVENGVLKSHIPEIITIAGHPNWTSNSDVVHTSATNINADYFVASYIHAPSYLAWVDGSTNSVLRTTTGMNQNFVPNAVDFTVFNYARFVTFNWVNAFTWGFSDRVWVLDVTSHANFHGNTETYACPAVVWECVEEIYGAKENGWSRNENYLGDVVFYTSADGYYLYLYFMFTNGYIVGVQFDCIDM